MRFARTLFLRLPPHFGYVRAHPHDVTLPFASAYVSSMVKTTGREVEVLDVWANGWSMEKVLNRAGEFRPDAVFLDSSAGAVPITLQVCREIKKLLPVKSIIFGTVPTYFPEVLFSDPSLFDVGMTGECEETSVKLLDAWEEGKSMREVAGLVYWDAEKSLPVKTAERPMLMDLDQLPHIDYSLFNLKHYRKFSFPVPLFRPVRWGHLLATRGCPYRCAFCGYDHRQSLGKEFRKFSPGRVADEFQILARGHGVNAVSIEDDCFTLDRAHVFALCDEIESRNTGVKWVAQTRVDLLDRALMKRMKGAGCVGLSLGVESGSDRILDLLRKGTTRAKSEKAIHEAAEEGLMLRLLFMIGNPTETEEEVEETLDLALKARAITIQVHFCTPYPGTSFFGQEKADIEHWEDYSSYNAIHRNLSKVPDQRLRELRNCIYHKYYFSWRYFKLFFRQRLLYLAGQAASDVPLILRAFWYMVRRPSASRRRSFSEMSGRKYLKF